MRNCENCISTLKATNIHINPKDLIHDICDFYEVRITDILSNKRDFSYVNIRNKIYDILYSNFDNKISLKQIGELFNGKDHSTIIHGIKQVKKFCEIYPDYNLEYKRLHLKIYGTLKFFKY